MATPPSTRRPRYSMMRRLLAVIAGIALLAIGVLIVSVSVLTRTTLSRDVGTEQLQVARRTLASVDRTLYNQQHQLELVAQDDSLLTALTDKKTAGVSAALNRLHETATATGAWENLRLVRFDGLVIASTAADETGRAYPALPAYQNVFAAATQGATHSSDPYTLPGTDRLSMVFAVPIFDETQPSRPVLGMVMGDVSWSTVLEALHGDTGHLVALFDRQGRPLEDVTGGQVTVEALTPVIQTALTGKEGSQLVAKAERGNEALVSYVHQQGYKDFPSKGWVVAVGTPTMIALASSRQLAATLPLAAIPVTIGALLLVLWFFNRTFVSPIRTLTNAARDLAAGGLLSHRVAIASEDEIGQLGLTLNMMADKMQSMYQGLERAVSERTAELAQKIDEVEAEKAKDEAILSSIGEGMIATDSAMRVLVANKVAGELLEFDHSQVHNHWLSEVVQLKLPDGHAVPLEQLPSFTTLKTAERHTAEFTYVRRDGHQTVVSVTANPIMQGDHTTGVIMILRDVTLDREVDRMKTEFISLASHQLRTPLSAIKWFSEMLLAGDAGKLNDEQHEFTENIAESTERMIELVDSLLNISRIESGRIIVEPEPTNMKELLDGIVDELTARVEARHQTLKIHVARGLPKVNLDPRLISQVYINLMTNAIKYTPDGGAVTVEVRRNGDQIVSSVTDTGYGIPKKAQQHMFEKFYRADNAVKVETDGTGLGLYLVKSIVDSSGGKIWFESAEGKGTTFWFTVPVKGMARKEGDVVLDDGIIF